MLLIAKKTAKEIQKIFSSFGKEGDIFLNSPEVNEAVRKSLKPGKHRELWKLAIKAEIQGKRKHMMFKICPFFLGGLVTKSIEVARELTPPAAQIYIQDLLPTVIEHGKYVKRNTKNTVPHLSGLETWLPCVLEQSSLVALEEIIKGLTDNVGGKMLRLSIDGIGDHFAFEVLNSPKNYPTDTATKVLPILSDLIKRYGDKKARDIDQNIYMGAMAHLLPTVMGGSAKVATQQTLS